MMHWDRRRQIKVWYEAKTTSANNKLVNKHKWPVKGKAHISDNLTNLYLNLNPNK